MPSVRPFRVTTQASGHRAKQNNNGLRCISIVLLSALAIIALITVPGADGKVSSPPKPPKTPARAKPPKSPAPVKSPKPPSPVKAPKPPTPVKSPKLAPPPKASPSPRRSPPPSPSPEGPSNVRLVRGSNGVGRLEVLVQRTYYYSNTPDDGNAQEWHPVCDDGLFKAEDAEAFCGFLGYQYGRQYREAGISTFSAQEHNKSDPLRAVNCDFFTYDEGDPTAHHRYSGLRGPWSTATFREGASCWFVPWGCSSDSALIALKCSGTPFPPTPSPPPRPPPPPPDLRDAIRIVDLEPNIATSKCPASNQYNYCGRVEVRVGTSANGRGGPAVWAPLCANTSNVANALVSYPITRVTCRQALGYRIDPRHEILSPYAVEPVKIPTGTVSGENAFNPAQYEYWATVVGNESEDAYTIQTMTLQVSKTRCASGYIVAVACMIAIE